MNSEESFNLEDWAATQGVEYRITDAEYAELMVLLEPAMAKCEELNIPYTFAFQAAFRPSDLGAALGGLSALSLDPGRVGPDFLLFQQLFARINPQEALAMVSWAVTQRLGAKDPAPTIILP